MKLNQYLRVVAGSKLTFAVICLFFSLALWFGFSEGFAAGQYFFNH